MDGEIWFHGFHDAHTCTGTRYTFSEPFHIHFVHSLPHILSVILLYGHLLNIPSSHFRATLIFYFLCVFPQVRLVFNKSVSWVRVRDDHILTVDQITFIADERFHAYHATENGMAQQSASSASSSSGMSTSSNQRRQLASGNNVGGGSNSVSSSSSQKSHGDTDPNGTGSNSANAAPWTLQIKYVQARDAGLYECQISSEPKISARVYLHVVGKLNKQTIFQTLALCPEQQFFILRNLARWMNKKNEERASCTFTQVLGNGPHG